MTETRKVFLPSKVEIYFRLAALFLIISVLWLLLFLDHSRRLEVSVNHSDLSIEQVFDEIQAGQRTENILLLLGLAFLTAFIGYSIYKIKKSSVKPLMLSSAGITPKGSQDEIAFTNIGTLLFTTKVMGENLIYMKGILVCADNSKNSTLDKVVLLKNQIDPSTFSMDDVKENEILGESDRLYLYNENEDIASELASSVTAANPQCLIYSGIDKFKKQRVLWEIKEEE